MADLAAPAPIETEKANFLHDRSRIPAAPKSTTRDLVERYAIIALALAGAFALQWLAFQTRDSWDSHRDWVVPMTTPITAAAGVCLGYLAYRRKWEPFMASFIWFALALILTGWNYALGREDNPDETLRDVLAISIAILIGIGDLFAFAGVVWVEMRSPTKAPTPQM